MIDIRDMQNVLIFKWIKKLQTPGTGAWRILPNFYLNMMGRNYSVFNSNIRFREIRGICQSFPTFYLKVLEVYLDLNVLKRDFIEKGSQILWNNTLVKYNGNVLYKRRWIENGFVYLSDMIDVKGKVKEYKDVADRLGDNTLTCMEYNLVKCVCQKLQAKVDTYVTDNTVYFNGMPLYKYSSKSLRYTIRNLGLRNNCDDEVVVGKWVKELNVDFSWVYKVVLECTREIRLHVLQWKILQGIYPTKSLLKKIGLSTDDLCEKCNVKETIQHFFYECDEIHDLWKIVGKDLEGKRLTEQEVMLGFVDNKKANSFILVAKLAISKYRYGEYKNLFSLYESEKMLRHM